ncbi:tryptophan halogenase family protein [Sphingomonas crusticola]|uniref:tryptophan halogenase family protein n=1 Tax=Sphingomonas crusticola TaxID=1697973 RepID=UPI001F0867D6|nr:tryptophan halogenase family protein [Sphingomonas crusticola]
MPIRSIVIVGGGTAGWMAAAALVGRFERQPIKITVVESPEIRTVGVGEATVPGIRDFFRDLGVSEAEVMRASQGTVKLGIDFVDWSAPGESFFHPFGLYGAPSRGVAFHHFWQKARLAGERHPIGDYSLATAMAKANRFMPRLDKPSGDLGVFDWAVHFDAGRFAQFLAGYSTKRGVTHVEGMVRNVHRNGESGLITELELNDGRILAGDLFIDCSGFRALLIGQTMGERYVDWTDLLPCDRAVAIPCRGGPGPLTPYTRSTARAAGWQWRIPLQHRVGNGYVYSSRHLSDDEAVATLRGSLEGEPLAEPNMLRFTTGHRTRFWSGNCVALGLAAGFLEPLESTSITLIQTGIEKLIELFPDKSFQPALADEFNRTTILEYERIRDFLLLHYWANGRHGEPMWDECRTLALPDGLARKLSLFQARGKLVRYTWETFHDPSWISMYAGFGITPDRYDPLADFFSNEEVRDALWRMRETVNGLATAAPLHDQFIAANCAAAN